MPQNGTRRPLDQADWTHRDWIEWERAALERDEWMSAEWEQRQWDETEQMRREWRESNGATGPEAEFAGAELERRDREAEERWRPWVRMLLVYGAVYVLWSWSCAAVRAL